MFILVLFSWPALCLGGLLEDQEDQNELHRLRQDRRSASKELLSDRTALSSAAKFGLLVIPVDFDGTRLPSTWSPRESLDAQLFGGHGSTMEYYFRVASGGNVDLKITLAPLVHMEGTRDSYSDVGYSGFHRTRALATEAITAVARQGLEFRRLDMDGPDGLPGSGDDDGQVDGVLILHSGPGQENDPAQGLIQPLQFFIDPPVESGGIQAAFYAVASLQSGLGIWAHETGHLLGMEDRYDPLLHPEASGVDVRSLGGLGRFSLMSSGAWGTGDGHNPALPDAYTSIQLGWTVPQRYPLTNNPVCPVAAWRGSGTTPVQVFSSGVLGSEFFLMETRDPELTYPFDMGLPSGQMLVYHVDETVPDGWYVSDGGNAYHLRARLVEADNDLLLQNGEDDGRPEDLFPGPLGVESLTPLTTPGTGGYGGPSGVSFEEITSHGNMVSCVISDSPSQHVIDLDFQVIQEDQCLLDLVVHSLANPMGDLQCMLTVSGEGGGEFPGGHSSQEFTLTEQDGIWTPHEPLLFVAPTNPPPGAITDFHFQFVTDEQDLPLEHQPWVWLSDADIFDFNDPGWEFWDQEFPNTEINTQWHLWNQAPFLTADESAVLACTGEDYPTSSAWPHVQYGRKGRAALISPILGPEIRAIQLTHAIEVEFLHAGTVMDGAAVFWQGPDGTLVPAAPVDGWDAVISPESDNTLGGAAVFADSLLILDENNFPQWRVDVLPLPDSGQGPWRLRLEFSSYYLWRWKGWVISSMEPLNVVPASAFPVVWNTSAEECPAGLYFSKPDPDNGFNNPVVEFFDLQTRNFEAIPDQENHLTPCASGFLMPRDFILNELQPLGLTRHLLRVLFTGVKGTVASRAVVVYPDDGARAVGYLEQPFPNPSTGSIKFLIDIPVSQTASLKIYDLRGRLVHDRPCSSGRYQIFWDGFDDQGRRLATGNYYLKLEGSGFSTMRKVVLIR